MSRSKECIVDQCQAAAVGRGYCKKHYSRWRRNGDPLVTSPKAPPSQLTHGRSLTPEYRAWASMRWRCLNRQAPNYAAYGGRGITICGRWLDSFEAFFEDMGPRPSPHHSLDRIDNDGNYTPENCRWGTRTEQQRNKRNCHFVTLRGERITIAELVERSSTSEATIRTRIKRGWSAERAIS